MPKQREISVVPSQPVSPHQPRAQVPMLDSSDEVDSGYEAPSTPGVEASAGGWNTPAAVNSNEKKEQEQ